MIQTLRGVIHGKTIQLEQDPGIEAGQQVEVMLRTKQRPGPPPGWTPTGTESAAGMLAESWTEEDDRVLEQIYHDRRHDRRSPCSEMLE